MGNLATLPSTPFQRDTASTTSLGGRAALWRSVSQASLLSCVLTLYFLMLASIRADADTLPEVRMLMVVGHLAAILGYAWLAVRLARANPILLLTPAASYMLCCSLFFGFGGLATIMVSDLTLSMMANNVYVLDEAGQLRANILTFTGSALVFLAMSVASLGRTRTVATYAHLPLRPVALSLVLAGLALKVGLLLPAAWGYLDWVVPGSLAGLAQLPDVGFLLMAIGIARGDRRLAMMFFWLWLPHLALCLLEFTKASVIFAVVMPALGGIIGGRPISRMLPWFLLACGLFIGMQNVNLAARNAVLVYSGVENQAPIAFRIKALAEAVSQARLADGGLTGAREEPPQLWWMRLNYSGAQVRAMELYDLGRPGEWDVSVLHFLIPRLLWPDKPPLENAGLEFNRMLTQNQQTLGRVAITVFGEGYWIAGWSGLVLFSVLTGLILGLATRYSLYCLEQRDYLYLPATLLAFKLGAFDVLGFFQTSILGGTITLIGVVIVTGWLARLLVPVR